MKKSFQLSQIIKSLQTNLLSEEELVSQFPFLKSLIDEFGRDVVLDQTKHFDFSLNDLKKTYALANEHVFNRQLPAMSLVDLVCCMKRNAKLQCNESGAFGWKLTHEDGTTELLPKPRLAMYVDNDDTFISCIGIVCHELIHLLDWKSGPMSKLLDEAITYTPETQMLGTYDVHGKDFFEKWVEKFADAGIEVEKHVSQFKKVFMTDEFGRFVKPNGDLLDGYLHEADAVSISSSDDVFTRCAKVLFNSIKSQEMISASIKRENAWFVIS